ncbi:MAG: FAD-dependent oxidoreductase [Planctomycetes bacterium]|nr:FAD-dependent oxidoreductase [Planctomycetota bacterium]
MSDTLIAREEPYDVIIIGAGIAGLSAAIYTTRERLSTLVIEKTIPGGQILTTARVENYPGFPEPIGGMELADRLASQATRFGAEIVQQAQVTRIESHPAEADGHSLDVFVGDARFRGRTMILAVGSEYKKLDVPGEKRLTGYGVSYCGTCDAPFYRDKHVVVVGGGDTALIEGLHILKFARHVTFVVRGQAFKAEQIMIDELAAQGDRVTVHFGHEVAEIVGETRVEAVSLKHVDTGETTRFACDGVFVFIGLDPLTKFLEGTVDLTEGGFIRAHACRLETSVPGIWAAGDARSDTMKQAATAAADGVVAALVAKEYLRDQARPRAAKARP